MSLLTGPLHLSLVSPSQEKVRTNHAPCRVSRFPALEHSSWFVNSKSQKPVTTSLLTSCSYGVPSTELLNLLPPSSTVSFTFGGANYLVIWQLKNPPKFSFPVTAHLFHELTRVLELLSPHKTFFSVYESGSTDATSLRLETLAATLNGMEIPHSIFTNGIEKHPRETRIEFLAKIRNKGLGPLFREVSSSETCESCCYFF